MKTQALRIGLMVLLLTVITALAWRVDVRAAASTGQSLNGEGSGSVELSFPTKPITIVVTFPPGGGTDLLARKLALELEKQWQQPIIVENKPGASGNIGARYVAESAADGYTLLMVNSSFAINPGVYKQLDFDPKKDFVPIMNVAWIPSLLVVGEQSPANNLAQALQQKKADSVAFASCGNGTPQHLAGEMLADRTGERLLHIPYKGCAPALTDIMASQVPMGFVTISSAMSFVQSGKLKPIAVTSPQRSPIMPEVPTLMELGIEDYELDQWHGLLAPANTPPAVVAQLNQALSKIMQQAHIQDELKGLGYTPAQSTVQEFTQIIHADIDRFANLTHRVGLEVN